MDSRLPNVFHVLQCTLLAGTVTFPRKPESPVLGELPFFLPSTPQVLPTSISTGLITPDGDRPSTSLTLRYYGWLSLAHMPAQSLAYRPCPGYR